MKTLGNSNKNIICYSCLLFLATLSSGCYKEPSFAIAPQITFLSVNRKAVNAFTDSITVQISFRDGDGDLGLAGAETDTKFGQFNADSTLNRFRNNYFIDIYKMINDTFEGIVFPDESFTFNSRFPVLNSSSIERPLEGELFFRFELFHSALGSPINKGDRIMFEVQIADRALNLSNKIETGIINIGN